MCAVTSLTGGQKEAVWENQKRLFKRGTEMCQVEGAGMKAEETVFTKVWIH